jgi:fucose 4-O-acetylase-like acetyltransferase
MGTSKRIESFDIAKGIGILLVILGHILQYTCKVRIFIYAFHMPLFFFLSGLFARSSNDTKTYAEKTFKRLLLPYIVFVLIDTLIYALDEAIIIKNHTFVVKGGLDIRELLISLFKVLAGVQRTFLNVPLWFLFSLFLIRFLYYSICKFKKPVSAGVISFITVSGFAFLLIKDNINLPENDNYYLTALVGFSYYALGDLFKKPITEVCERIDKNRTRILLLLSIVFCISFIITYIVSQKNAVRATKLIELRVYNPYLYIIASLSGIIMSISLAILLSSSKQKAIHLFNDALSYFGKNSIIIMITHYYFVVCLVENKILELSDKKYLIHNPYFVAALFLTTVVLMVPTIWVFNNYLYFLTGQEKQLSKRRNNFGD